MYLGLVTLTEMRGVASEFSSMWIVPWDLSSWDRGATLEGDGDGEGWGDTAGGGWGDAEDGNGAGSGLGNPLTEPYFQFTLEIQ